MTNVLLFGSTGRLGRVLAMQAESYGFTITAPLRSAVDLESRKAIRECILDLKPRYIINAAAMNGLEACELEPDRALAINALAPATMATAARDLGAFFVHYSTDYTVATEWRGDGELLESAPYVFHTHYGTSKVLAELMIQRVMQSHLIFRLSSLYGDDLQGALGPVSQAMIGKGSATNPIKVLSQVATPTSTQTVAQMTLAILRALPEESWRRISGVYNMVNSGPVWKSDFARLAVREFLGLKDLTVMEGTLVVPRPVFCVLSNAKLQEVFGIKMPSVAEDLAERVKEYKAKRFH